jgi:hypothetical protein
MRHHDDGSGFGVSSPGRGDASGAGSSTREDDRGAAGLHHGPVHVTIRLRGSLGPTLAVAFEELSPRTETVLSCELEDDAALHGVLNHLHDLGLQVLDLRMSGDAPERT